MEDEQLQFRGSFDALADPRPGHEGERPAMPCLPFRGNAGLQPPAPGAPPSPGEHTAEVVEAWSAPSEWPEPTASARRLPLDGVRVVDFCWNIAGPIMGRALGDLGAEIVKIEPREMGDPSRGLVPFRGGVTNLNGSYTFHDINRDKQSVTIDMRKPNAAAVALGIIKHADVVIENFTGGTMGRLGASYEFVAEANPRAIMASLTGFGQNGPRGSWPSYHPTSSALSGLTWLFGYEGEGPLGFGHSHMDYMAGYLGALGVLDGLLRRELTGEGDHVDVSQLECGATLVGPQVLQWTVNGETARPEGNRAGALGAPLQGCYQCSGDDQWIAVTAADSETLAKLGELTGAADGSPGAVEAALAAWCATLEPWDAFHRLQEAGVAAGVVSHGPDLERDEHLAARGAVAKLPHPELGEAVIIQCPVVLDGERLAVRRPASLLGEHNEHILLGVVGMSEEGLSQPRRERDHLSERDHATMTALPEFSIEGKKAIVTGAGRGIGKAIALTLAEAGVDVCVAARSRDELDAVADEIRAMGRRAAAIPTDITDEASVAAMVDGALRELGEIDVLVNNAGIAVVKPLVPLPGLKPATADSFPGFFEPYTSEEWSQVMDVNLRGAFFCMRAVGPHMLERGSGKVVNISSINAERAGRYRFTYDTSKAALNRMTKSIAVEWARHGVQVNAICATYVDTDLIRVSMEDERLRLKILAEIPMRRLADAREVGLVTAFLSSSASDFMTGACVFLDGGSTS